MLHDQKLKKSGASAIVSNPTKAARIKHDIARDAVTHVFPINHFHGVDFYEKGPFAYELQPHHTLGTCIFSIFMGLDI